jgi:hypothetical protein
MRFHAVRSHMTAPAIPPYRGGHQGSALDQAASCGAARTAGITIGSPGLEVGIYCPDCQTVEEGLAAELDLVVIPSPRHPSGGRSTSRMKMTRTGALGALIAKYSTPEIMRHNADLLSAAQPGAAELVRMMRRIADDRSTQFMTCEKPGTHHGGTVHQVGRSAYQTRIQSMSMAAGKLPREGSPPPGPPTARVNIGDSQ